MGDETAIVQAARISYGRGTKRKSEDKALLRYLLRNGHTSPFEMCEIKLHVKLPIFVARQWIRHRTASVNEYSARYSIVPDEFYVPHARDIGAQSKINRQGRSTAALHPDIAERVAHLLQDSGRTAFELYHQLIGGNDGGSDAAGISRELARIGLPLSSYTEWYWKIDLHNLLRFIKLRSSSHAQLEIREYSNAIISIVKKWVPNVFSAFEDYDLNAVTLSPQSVNLLKSWVRGLRPSKEESGLSNSEWDALGRLFLD